ncbi:hypothetical protein IWQ60_004547 [Tieghemiomyces parasiticus]|uniref:Oxidoreductase n=1 Tax=Tieghemiomyces parasiticus TaxID=78921 RepID=A0A9W8A7M7_9FUNG|nr:hypothetical protein IWQ60_004547 [Tieghemiomyces parasiticus]
MDDVCTDAAIHLVIITTPNDSHASLARQALQAGKHVMVEKPLVNSYAEAQELVQLATERNLILTVFHNRRLDGDFLTVKQLIESARDDSDERGMLGRIVYYESHFDRYRDQLKPNHAWREAAGPGSGVLADLGPHLLDQALYLFGTPDTVTADVRNQRRLKPNDPVDDTFTVHLDYRATGLRCTLTAGMLVRMANPLRFMVNGTRGTYLKYGGDPQEAQLQRGKYPFNCTEYGLELNQDKWGQIDTTLPDAQGGLHLVGRVEPVRGNYGALFEALGRAVVDHDPAVPVVYAKYEALVSPREAAQCIRLIELCRQSSEEKRTVAW